MTYWRDYWKLASDPFEDRRSAYVMTSGHSEALARLIQTIETASRSARLIAEAGLGKTRVLTRALELTRSPERRFARIACPEDGADLFARLAIELGTRVAPGASRAIAWRGLVEAVRLCRWQGLQVILAIDDCQQMESGTDRGDLERLHEIDPDPSTRLTVLRLGRPREEIELEPEGESLGIGKDWSFSIRLKPLTRSETENYITTKLKAAGRLEPCFSPRAISRLHSLSEGTPRGINRLATLGLMASASRALEMVTPNLVDEAASDFPMIASSSTRF